MLVVESGRDELPSEQQQRGDHGEDQAGEDGEILRPHLSQIAEQDRLDVHVAVRRTREQQHADRHADRPEHADRRILVSEALAAQRRERRRGEDCDRAGAEPRVETEQHRETDATEGGVRDAATEGDEPAQHHDGADEAAEQAREHGRRERRGRCADRRGGGGEEVSAQPWP